MDALVELARVPRRPPRADVVLAGGLLVWAGLEAALLDGPGPGWARALTAIAFSVPLVLRRRRPVEILVLIVAVLVIRGVTSDVPESGSMPFPALLVGTFSAALYARPAALAVAAAAFAPAAIGTALVTGYFSGSPQPADLAILTFLSLGAWTAGWVVRRRAAQLAEAEAAAPELAREAVAAERARMARELHDIVAHSVSIISVQAGAAEALLDGGDPDSAKPHVQAVRRTAHEALVELRRLLGVLREEEPGYRPQPGLDRLGDLIDEARAAGLSVDLEADGAPNGRIPAGVDLAAYRIVQEGLTNARRHAGPVHAVVRVRRAPDRLEVEVVNAAGPGDGAAGGGSGQGLIGMRERARLSGGTLEAGPAPDGGFRVRASLPLEEAPA